MVQIAPAGWVKVNRRTIALVMVAMLNWEIDAAGEGVSERSGRISVAGHAHW